MNFEYTEQVSMVRDMVRAFAEKEIKPHVREWDKAGKLPPELLAKLGELGLMGSVIPAEYGGAGFGYHEYVAIVEELSRVDGSVGLTVAAHTSLCTNHIYLSGTEEQKQKYLPNLASGEWIGAWGLTEPGAGSDAGGTKTTAVRDGDSWVLNGAKMFITNATIAKVAIIIAKTEHDVKHRGISAFIVEYGTPGFAAGKKEDKLGLRACDTAEIALEDVRIPMENLLGKEGDGFVDSMRVLDGGRISIAALSLGIAQGAYEAAISFAKQREQFGKTIASFQAIQWMLADMATEIDAARLLTHRAANLLTAKQKVTRESAMAKLYASETAVRATERSVQIHGGYGYMTEYPAEKFYRDVKLCTIGEGTSEIQRLVISRSLLD